MWGRAVRPPGGHRFPQIQVRSVEWCWLSSNSSHNVQKCSALTSLFRRCRSQLPQLQGELAVSAQHFHPQGIQGAYARCGSVCGKDFIPQAKQIVGHGGSYSDRHGRADPAMRTTFGERMAGSSPAMTGWRGRQMARLQRGLHLLDDFRERRGIVVGDRSQYLTVHLDAGLLQPGDEPAVGQAVLAHRRVDALDP